MKLLAHASTVLAGIRGAAHSPGSARVGPRRELDLSRRFGERRSEFGLGVVLGQPPARSINDDQTDRKKGDTGKDLDATLLRLGGDLAGRARGPERGRT